MKYLGPFAFYTHTPVRVYVLQNCTHSRINWAMQFPHVKTTPPSKAAVGVAAVREMFAEDPNVQVTEDNKIIRVWIGRCRPTSFAQS
jgi:hypothetical protein